MYSTVGQTHRNMEHVNSKTYKGYKISVLNNTPVHIYRYSSLDLDVHLETTKHTKNVRGEIILSTINIYFVQLGSEGS